MTFSTNDGLTRVFLDANIIVKPVTRTLLMVGGVPSGFHASWSMTAEQEATAHMRSRAVEPALIRERFGFGLMPTGSDAERFLDTKGADGQILADAVAGKACFVITEDVDDYGQRDLSNVGISAVNPDLFLAERLTRDAYATVVDLFVERQVKPPATAARFHAAIAKNHPRLFSVHADLYETDPDQGVHHEPAVIFRGPRCVRCEQIVATTDTIVAGPCPECR